MALEIQPAGPRFQESSLIFGPTNPPSSLVLYPDTPHPSSCPTRSPAPAPAFVPGDGTSARHAGPLSPQRLRRGKPRGRRGPRGDPPLTFNLGPDGQEGRVAAFAPADRSCGAPRPLPDAVPRARDPCRPVASAEPSDRLSMRAWTSPVYAPVEREHRSPLAAAAFARRTELRRDTSACTRANTSFGETGLPSLRPIGAAAQIDALLAVPDVVDPWGVHARCHPSAQCRRRHCPKERR